MMKSAMTALDLATQWATPSHLLLVDDDLSLCDLLDRALQALGCTCEQAHDGNKALEALRNRKFSGVLLDIRIPEINGFGVIKEMKRLNINVPVIVITGYPDEEVHNLIRSFGVLAVIEKPFSPANLEETLGRYLSIFNVRHHPVKNGTADKQ